jgi:hypothetical protein
MFGLENSANNFGASAGLLANTLANRPVQAALGTIFYGTDNLFIYRYNGTNWVTYTTGAGISGATNGLQVIGANVGLGGTLTQNTDISGIGSFSFKFQNYSSFAIGNSTEPSMIFDTAAETIITYNNGIANGLNFDYGSNVYTFGDFTGTANATHFIIDDSSELINTFSQGFSIGLSLDFANQVYNFGDFSNVLNGTYIMVDNSAQEIKTWHTGSNRGLLLDFANLIYTLGDYNGSTNQYYITIDDGLGELRFNGANLQSNSASGSSGEHLVIWLNGSNYKIKLENP